MSANPDRRRLLGLGALLIASPALAARALAPTPWQTPGPFYPVQLPLDDDNDLTQVKGRPGVARGEPVDLTGRVLDRDGQPLAGVRVEIWQCDYNGRYRHPHEQGSLPVDENFQGHGHTRTDAAGRYRFRTIKPVPYPGRTPHIHIAVITGPRSAFTTQIYVRGEPLNERDFLFVALSGEQQERVLAEFVAGSHGLTASFDVVLGATPPA